MSIKFLICKWLWGFIFCTWVKGQCWSWWILQFNTPYNITCTIDNRCTKPCIATRLMIKNVSVIRGTTFIKLQWPAPRFHPLFYHQTMSCKLWCNKVPYLFIDRVKAFDTTSSLVGSVKPGSKCVIGLKAVYNLATLDQGITIIVSTPFGGNDRNGKAIHIYIYVYLYVYLQYIHTCVYVYT